MKKINVMLIRDLKIFKSQIIAAVIIIFAGITLFASSVMSFKNLEFSKEKFYSTNNFLDYYTVGSNLNNEELKEVQQLKEVKEAQGRLELEASLKISSSENIFARIVAINEEPKVNKLKYVEGNFIRNKDEVLLSKSFCKYHKLAIGDKVKIKVLNSEKEYVIAGIVESPEFIYTVKSREYIMPSIEDYTIVYMEIEEIMEKMNAEDVVYNQFHVTLKDGYKYEDVKDKTKDIIGDKFITEVERKNQISEVMLREDIGMIAEIAYMFPVMFLTAAALVIIVIQKKLIDLQKTNIGVMKAMGYKNNILIRYYLKQALIIGCTGSIVAIVPSYYLSIYITKVYSELVYIPVLEFKFSTVTILVAIALSNIVALVATYTGIKQVLKISAAEAMRPASIGGINFDPSKYMKKTWKKLKSDNRMVIRNIFRNKTRSIFSIICFMITFVLFASPIFLYNSVTYSQKSQYEYIQNFDYKINFTQPVDNKVIQEIIKTEGIVDYFEVVEVPIEINGENNSRKLKLIGIEDGYEFNDINKDIKVKKDSFILPRNIANSLGLELNDSVEVKVNLDSDKKLKMKLTEVFDQNVGFSGYVNINEIRDVLDIKNLTTCIYVKANEGVFKENKSKLLENPLVKRIDSTAQEKKEFITLLKLVNMFIGVMIIFGILMSFSSVYNSAMINIMERKREWGTLKVLGYSNKRIQKMNIKESIALAIISLVPSFIITNIVCYVLSILMSNDFFNTPFKMTALTYVLPSILVLIISIISLFIYKYELKKIKVSDVIKVKE